MESKQRKPLTIEQIKRLEERGAELEKDITKHALYYPISVDEILRDIAFQMKQGQGPAVIPEAPGQWGKLSAKEGRERVLREFGFDPGWA